MVPTLCVCIYDIYIYMPIAKCVLLIQKGSRLLQAIKYKRDFHSPLTPTIPNTHQRTLNAPELHKIQSVQFKLLDCFICVSHFREEKGGRHEKEVFFIINYPLLYRHNILCLFIYGSPVSQLTHIFDRYHPKHPLIRIQPINTFSQLLTAGRWHR